MEPTPIPRITFADMVDWPELDRAFQPALRLDLRQSWLAEPQPGLRPAHALFGWDPVGAVLGVLVHLRDDDILTEAVPGVDNQRLWALGDAAELFIGQVASPVYHEFHLAPGGQVLRLRFPSRKSFLHTNEKPLQPERLTRHMLPHPPGAAFMAQVDHAAGCWRAFFQIPFRALAPRLARARLPGSLWRLNLARYDYTGSPIEPPILSATAPLTRRSFHRRQDWTTVVLE